MARYKASNLLDDVHDVDRCATNSFARETRALRSGEYPCFLHVWPGMKTLGGKDCTFEAEEGDMIAVRSYQTSAAYDGAPFTSATTAALVPKFWIRTLWTKAVALPLANGATVAVKYVVAGCRQLRSSVRRVSRRYPSASTFNTPYRSRGAAIVNSMSLNDSSVFRVVTDYIEIKKRARLLLFRSSRACRHFHSSAFVNLYCSRVLSRFV